MSILQHVSFIQSPNKPLEAAYNDGELIMVSAKPITVGHLSSLGFTAKSFESYETREEVSSAPASFRELDMNKMVRMI